MNQFIEELKIEHGKIIGFFNTIEASEKFNDQKNLVKELTALVVIHLKKEDEQLYPKLALSKNEEISKMGSIFSMAMKNNSKDFVAFVERFLSSTEPNSELMDTYKMISGKIRDRITIEETVLYPAYEQSI